MLKTVLKEVGIAVLLLIAISLLFGILLYEYIPNNKTVPAKVEAYAFPSEIERELSSSLKGEQEIVRTFYIDSTDLNSYEYAREYNKGKANPFSDMNTGSSNNNSSGTTSSGSSSKTNSSNTSSNNTSSNTNSTQRSNTSNTVLFILNNIYTLL